ncbi:MAG TPA: phospho-sugar mutase [Actinomycetes bacterium]|nr:phospho-sugar mutase [Actinomycetes bacterium]
MSDPLLDRARAWLAEDPDPDTRAELEALIVADNRAELAERFAGRLEFGTAGLRGALGAGPMRMNRVVVIRAAAGVAAYVNSRGGRAVVVGFDARHNSDVFARDTAAVLVGAGLRALVLPRPLPTPVLAYAIRHLGCDAGIMVTASHNPPQDNGYKVYLGDGAQIAPPTDAEISAAIDAVGPLATVPRVDGWDTLDESVLEAYLDRVAGLVPPTAPRELTMVYTPLHGVGGEVLVDALQRAGFAAPRVVPVQAEPDPNFPTVSFPNPEEPGALDLALEAAVIQDADLVLANDPDADRCAVAVPLPDGSGWRMLTGDEVGALLGAWLLRTTVSSGTLAASIVSSSLLSTMAQRHDVDFAETLTGFKWLSRVEGLRYAYEEALGYCVDPAAVRDKDGISAATRIAEMAAALKADGRTLLDLLDDLAREYGLYATSALSLRVTDLAEIDAAMARLRATPPTSLGALTVTSVDDLALGSDDLPPTEGLRYRLAPHGRVVVRPSGTEPKLKSYLEVVLPVAPDDDLVALRAQATDRLSAISADLAAALGR